VPTAFPLNNIEPGEQMEHAQELIDRLLADFKDWSGGFSPEECDHHKINAYIVMARPDDVDEQTAREILEHHQM